jgi:hypothetical protein
MELWSPGTLCETKSKNKDLQTTKKGNAAEMSKKKKEEKTERNSYGREQN